LKKILQNTVLGAIFLAGVLSITATSHFPCMEPDIADVYDVNGSCPPPPPPCAYSDCFFNADPIYLSYEELRATSTIKVILPEPTPEPLKKAGKIFVLHPTLFINDLNRGVHVYDNTDPKAPKLRGFISIPGNVDIAVKGSVLFADSYIDLVAIDIAAFPQMIVSKRIEKVFPYNPYQAIDDPSVHLRSLDEKKGVVIGYTKDDPLKLN
jgi:hypothetical protein